MTSASIPSFKKTSFALIALGIILLFPVAFSSDFKVSEATIFNQIMNYCADWFDLSAQSLRNCSRDASNIDQKLSNVRQIYQFGFIAFGLVTIGLGVIQLRKLNVPLLPPKSEAHPPTNYNTPANFSASPPQPSTPPPAHNSSIEDELRQLRDLKANGVLSSDEYEKLLEKVMSKLN